MPGDKQDWVMVTGASAGMGRALAARLAEENRNVVAAARDLRRLPVTSGRGRIIGIELDLEDPDATAAGAAKVAEIVGSGRLAGLVNMAGVIVEGPLEAIPPRDLRRQLDVNLVGPFALTQALLPMLKAGRGKVVNIGAISAHITVPFYGPIAASKSALAALNEAMRLEFAQYGIEVVLIEPGAMQTGIFATSRAARDARLAQVPEAERRYRSALAAMDSAFEKAGGDDPKVVVDAVLRALSGHRVKPRQVVGKGTGALMMLSRLPIPLRDRLVKNALGLSEALKPLS